MKDRQRQQKFGNLEKKVNKILVKKREISRNPNEIINIVPKNEDINEYDSENPAPNEELTRISISATTKQKSRTR